MFSDLRKRFVSDNNYPLNVFEDDVWEFYLDLFPDIKQNWNKLLEGIIEEYSGNYKLFLNDFYSIRESILKSFKSKSEYLEFNGKEGDNFIKSLVESTKDFRANKRNTDIYNQSFVDKEYLSLDLNKANMQAFYKFNNKIFSEEPMEDVNEYYVNWIRSYIIDKPLLYEYIPKSKYLRQVIFGNCNPSRQITIEKGLISKIGSFIEDKFGYNIVMLGSDEVIFEIDSNYKDINYRELIKQNFDLYITSTYFKLSSYKFNTGNHLLEVFSRDNLKTGEKIYKKIPKHYYAQVFEILNNIKPDPLERDLVFYNNEEPAKFLKRITLL